MTRNSRRVNERLETGESRRDWHSSHLMAADPYALRLLYVELMTILRFMARSCLMISRKPGIPTASQCIESGWYPGFGKLAITGKIQLFTKRMSIYLPSTERFEVVDTPGGTTLLFREKRTSTNCTNVMPCLSSALRVFLTRKT